MKFLGKSRENFKKLGIKKKQEKFWENLAAFLKKFQSSSFIENIQLFYTKYGFFMLNMFFFFKY